MVGLEQDANSMGSPSWSNGTPILHCNASTVMTKGLVGSNNFSSMLALISSLISSRACWWFGYQF